MKFSNAYTLTIGLISLVVLTTLLVMAQFVYNLSWDIIGKIIIAIGPVLTSVIFTTNLYAKELEQRKYIINLIMDLNSIADTINSYKSIFEINLEKNVNNLNLKLNKQIKKIWNDKKLKKSEKINKIMYTITEKFSTVLIKKFAQYGIRQINSYFYNKELDSSLGNTLLKQDIIKLSRKILTINQQIDWINQIIRSNPKSQNEKVKKVLIYQIFLNLEGVELNMTDLINLIKKYYPKINVYLRRYDVDITQIIKCRDN